MLKARVIPCLLLEGESLVKTVRFQDPNYIGDPINTVWIYNEMEVDELIFLDITATKEKRKPNFKIIEEIANECFMPLAYGGGVRDIADLERLFKIGIEKISINSYAFENPDFITEVSKLYGSQSIIVSIDIKNNYRNKYEVYTVGGSKNVKLKPVEWARRMEQAGAGELLITSINRDGTWDGYDVDLIRMITRSVSIPVIACGGAGKLDDFAYAVNEGGASAVAAGSMFVYQKKDLGVLIKYPAEEELVRFLYKQ